MLRIVILGIGIVALILFVAWIFRDPIYVMLMDQGIFVGNGAAGTSRAFAAPTSTETPCVHTQADSGP